MNDDQLDIKEIRPGTYELTFPYNEDFIGFIKMKVPYYDRSYDEDTRVWTVRGEKYVSHLESVGLQKFSYVMRISRGEEGVVYRNCRTGTETVQRALF